MHTIRNPKTRFVTETALVAAVYTVLTMLSALFGLDKFVIQLRLGEILTVLPVFTPAAVPGLTLGCLIASTVTGAAPYDILFGSLATLAGAVGTRLLRKRHPALAVLPPIVANTVVVPPILAFVYGLDGAIPVFAAFVFVGETLSAGVGGMLLYRVMLKIGEKIGWNR